MPLEFERIGMRTFQQPLGLVVDSHILRPDEDTAWVLNPAFQRGSVWTQKQKVAWIETMLRGLGLPAIFINRFQDHPIYGYKSVVIDGQQRLRATAEFMRDEFRVRGELWSEQDIRFQRTAHTSEELARARKFIEECDS